jgi:hypothetical protein
MAKDNFFIKMKLFMTDFGLMEKSMKMMLILKEVDF